MFFAILCIFISTLTQCSDKDIPHALPSSQFLNTSSAPIVTKSHASQWQNYRNPDTALFKAVVTGNYTLAENAINSGANLNQTHFGLPLIFYNINPNIDTLMQRRGARTHAITSSSKMLHAAMLPSFKYSEIEQLLKQGVRPNVRNDRGDTPLHTLARNVEHQFGSANNKAFLLLEKLSPQQRYELIAAKNNADKTVFDLLAASPQTDVVKKLRTLLEGFLPKN